jgi:hypothetical protein
MSHFNGPQTKTLQGGTTMKRIHRSLALLGLTMAMGVASAQTTVTLPDTSQTSTMTANVSEQCRIDVPSTITFNVTNIGSNTNTTASVTIDRIVLASDTKQLKLSIKADAAGFTPPVEEATTWSASDVSWSAGTWTNGTGASGTLSSASYNEIVTADADTASVSNNSLSFTLAAKTTVKRSGNHTLGVTWKVESIAGS